jgi:hypothetical protein
MLFIRLTHKYRINLEIYFWQGLQLVVFWRLIQKGVKIENVGINPSN